MIIIIMIIITLFEREEIGKKWRENAPLVANRPIISIFLFYRLVTSLSIGRSQIDYSNSLFFSLFLSLYIYIYIYKYIYIYLFIYFFV